MTVKYQKTLLTLPSEVTEAFSRLSDDGNSVSRDAYIQALRGAGWTLQSIAAASSITRERVRQIATGYLEGGASHLLTAGFELPIPLPPLVADKPKPVYVEPKPETLARLLELKPLAVQVRSNSPRYRDEAEEYTRLIHHAYTVEGVTLYRLAKRLGVTHGALRFRLARYQYIVPESGTSKVYTPIRSANRTGSTPGGDTE